MTKFHKNRRSIPAEQLFGLGNRSTWLAHCAFIGSYEYSVKVQNLANTLNPTNFEAIAAIILAKLHKEHNNPHSDLVLADVDYYALQRCYQAYRRNGHF